jgi:DNA-binding transcriptional LysR family regulator
VAVRDLENSLGARLFERLGRSVSLTPAGRALEVHARRALAELEAGRSAVAEVLGLTGGSVRVSCLPTLASEPLATAIGAFHAQHPDVHFSVESPEDVDELLQSVLNGRSEIGLTSSTALPQGLIGRDAGLQSLSVILPPGTAASDPLPVAQLAELEFVAYPTGTSLRTILDDVLASIGARPRISVEISARDAVVPLVVGGAGAALVPDHLGRGAAERGAPMVSLDPPIHREIQVVHRTGPLAPGAELLARLLTGEGPSQTRPL